MEVWIHEQLVTTMGLPPLYAFQTRDLMFIFRIFCQIPQGYAPIY